MDHLTLVNPSSLNSMRNELCVVLHNRENALLTQAIQNFAREEHEYAENVANNWMSLSEGVENNRICLTNELCILVM